MFKFKEYGLYLEPVRTVSKVKIWYGFIEFYRRSLILSLRREDGPSDSRDESVVKEIYLVSP